jgi:hypothetical protein
MEENDKKNNKQARTLKVNGIKNKKKNKKPILKGKKYEPNQLSKLII